MYGGSSVAGGPLTTKPNKHHRYSSISGSSASTVKRTASLSSSARNSVLPMRSQSPGETSLIALRVNTGAQVTQYGKRRKSIAVDPSELTNGEGMVNLDRWSQSTDSSAPSPAKTRRKRASSGAVLSQQLSPPRNAQIDHSPVASPSRKPLPSPQSIYRRQKSPTESPERGRRMLSHAKSPFDPLNTEFGGSTAGGADSNDTASPSTARTGTSSTADMLTPSTRSSYAQDYFGGENVSPKHGAVGKRPTAPRTVTAPGSTLNYSRMPRHELAPEVASSRRQSEMVEYGDRSARPVTAILDNEGRSEKRPRHRERMEKDKKAMLSKALQKANTAVLLDNAQNFEGALEAYMDACRLLQQVMDRSSGAEDKIKLDAIRVTYTNRIEELRQLDDGRPPTREEKGLPTRPMSDDSVKSPQDLPTSPIDGTIRDSAVIETATATRMMDVPRLGSIGNVRDSFFSKTIADVERAGRGSDASIAEQRRPSPQQETRTPADDLPPAIKSNMLHLPPTADEHSRYMPAPLSPRRIPPPTFDPATTSMQHQAEPQAVAGAQDERLEEDEPRERKASNASVSWLDTIDETASSCGSSVHSVTAKDGLRRKRVRGHSAGTDAEFDAAFDAAVEAAYDEGLEPDYEHAHLQQIRMQHARQQSTQVTSPDVKEILLPTAPTYGGQSLGDEIDDEEEERILEEFTADYAHGFNFDLSTKSALPRQSDSSAYSISTWQSSQVSDRTTAGTSLSTVPEDLLSIRDTSKPISMISAASTVKARPVSPPTLPPPTSALPKPPTLSEKRESSTVRARRLSGQNPKQLKIETSAKPEGRKRASTFHVSPSAPLANQDELTRSFASEITAPAPDELPTVELQHDQELQSPPSVELRSAVSQGSMPMTSTSTEPRMSLDESPGELRSFRPSLFRKNKSSISLRDHSISLPSREDSDSISTPMTSIFQFRSAADSLTAQRSTASLHGSAMAESQYSGGAFLFDTSLSSLQMPTSPRSPTQPTIPSGLEPCPESFLLRPFWLMRAICTTITHQRGGFITQRLFVPREVWQTRGVKIKSMEDKAANCDLLTAALGRLANVDTYDADAVMEELQNFEEVMERVQTALVKKLGSEVGVQGAMGMFRDAPSFSTSTSNPNSSAPGSDTASTTDKNAKSNSGKSYLSSWRKLRSKSSGAPLASSNGAGHRSQASAGAERGEPQHMPSVPMTSFISVERRGQKSGRDVKSMVFEGPQREYMGSVARLVAGVGVLGARLAKRPQHSTARKNFLRFLQGCGSQQDFRCFPDRSTRGPHAEHADRKVEPATFITQDTTSQQVVSPLHTHTPATQELSSLEPSATICHFLDFLYFP
ncbi:hypothetical protein B0A48_15078 [Cryoendolithus antarcticus]|uniref:MIT domain-containing protein n=1 Tax=Cryoendolithus antarcticus TaxID=1507870 RepID=A0A1V8SJG9_9PEZI|nr:hypothetical protein B0A48_15078 [Cryoendolithus antarcticus]